MKLSGLISGKVAIAKKVGKVNLEYRVVFWRLELVDAAPDSVVQKKRIRKYRYRKNRKDESGRMARKRSWRTDNCFLFSILRFFWF